LDWAYELDFDPSDSDAQAKRNDWTTKTKDLLSRFEKWAAQVPETRVDVNESVDALSVVPPADAAEARAFFYECLFVGRHFGRSLLSLLNFRRCTFIRCTFDASEHHFELNDCYFFSTRFQGSNANIAILNSRLLNVSINAQQGSEIALRHCEVHSSRFAGTLTHLKLTDCTLHRIVVSGVRRDDGSLPIATIDFNDSVLVNSTLRRFALSSESDLHFAASPDIAFNEVDLAAVTNLDSRMLHAVKADAKTIHPIKAERPASWPKYDAKDDDDIPF
jgi:hypothetical protein